MAEERQAEAQTLLEDVPLIELTDEQAVQFVGSALPDLPGAAPYLVLGLYHTPGTGKHVVYVSEEGLVVHHGSLGRSAPPVTRQALVLQLEGRPAHVYVVSSVNQ